jgi:hypothetical protein
MLPTLNLVRPRGHHSAAMTDSLETMTAATLLAWTRDGGAPRLTVLASPAWSDGAHLWLVAASVEQAFVGAGVAALLTGPAGVRAVARGTVRAYGLHDPVGLALHGAAAATALGALALRAAGAVRRALPAPFALRLDIETLEALTDGAGEGIAPALPAVVPSDVRRGLAGVRDIVITRPLHAAVEPARWGGGYILEGSWSDGPAAAVLTAPGGGTGLALEGELSGGVLHPARAVWWHDGVVDEAPATARTTFVLPE